MPTLKTVLEEVAGLGPGYLLSEHGAYWLVSDVLERLEQDAPERLACSVSWAVSDNAEAGAIYVSDDTEHVLTPVPLYQIHRLTRTLEPFAFSDTGTHHPENT